MVGVVLLFVGSVLLVNGMGGLGRVETRSMAVLNFMVGGLALIATLLLFVRAGSNADYLTVAQFFLFTFTYLFAATCLWLNLDMRAFGWFCFFVAVTTGRRSFPFPRSKLYSSSTETAATRSSGNNFFSLLASKISSSAWQNPGRGWRNRKSR